MATRIWRRLIQLYCRHAPLDRGKYRLSHWAYVNFNAGHPESCITQLGNGLNVQVNLAEFIHSQIYYLGFYELYLARYFQTLVRPSRIFADVGAHIGQYTLIAAAGGMEAHAFEPDPLNFAYLSQNVRMNNLNAHLNQCAVADFAGEATLFPYGDESIRNNSLRRIATVSPASRSEIVTPVIYLDKYFAGQRDQIHLIKADVEGAELSVLQGACEILLYSHPILILEVVDSNTQPYGYTATDLKRFLSTFSYRFYTLDRQALKPVSLETQAPYENLICFPAQD